MLDPERVVKVDDFVVMRRVPETPEMKAGTASRDRDNATFLERNPPPPERGTLAGTFVYEIGRAHV